MFYLFLTAVNLFLLFFNPGVFTGMLPPGLTGNEAAASAFRDAWLVFVLELGVLGGMLLYASRQPAQARLLVLTVIWAEVFRGIVADVIWILRGWPVASYVPFIIIHVVIIATGVWVMRLERGARLCGV